MTTPILSLDKKVFGLIFCTLLILPSAWAQITSNFSANNENWNYFDPTTGGQVAATWSSVNGNPAGDITLTIGNANVGYYWVAPAKFNGNWGVSYNQNLTFDILVSAVGSDNSLGDVILAGPSGTIMYQLPAKPTAGSWTSYAVPLNEAQWHNGGPTQPAPSQTLMKAILSNVTTFEIRCKFLTSVFSPYNSQLDNVVLNKQSIGPTPTITSISPTSGVAGTVVTITGTNFNGVASSDQVFFNGVLATVTSASTTQLTVTVPKSAGYGPITVANAGAGLQVNSVQNFDPLFNNNQDFGGRIIPATMSRGYYTVLQTGAETNNQSGMVSKGDFDGDGWVDLVATDTGPPSVINVFRNKGGGGTVSASSFSPATVLSIATVPGGSPNLGPLSVADVDSDGKPDIVAITSGGSGAQGYLAVFRNTSTPGSIAFAAPQFFAYAYYSSQLTLSSGDFDGDGRIDFIYTTGTSPGGIWISQNLSTPGNVDFAYGYLAGSTLGHLDVKTGDLNGDGLPEIVACIGGGVEIYQNTSVKEAISFNAPFTITGLTSASYLQVADLDGDNKPDLTWSGYIAQNIYMARNVFSGTLNASSFGSTITYPTKLSLGQPIGFGMSDINSDGKPDLVIAGNSDIGVMQNLGGTLSATSFLPTAISQGNLLGSGIYALGPAIADLDGDNKPEVAFVYSNYNVSAAEKGIYIFHNESFPVPTITSTSPSSALAGSSISLNGNLMYTGNVNPSVRLNKILAPLQGTATNILTKVTSPLSEMSGKFNITNHGLTSYSPFFTQPFNTARVINASSFSSEVDFGLTNPADVLQTGDFNDDGKIDVVISDSNGAGIFQNSTTAGQNITSSSLSKFGTTYSSYSTVQIFDVDGDGKTDISTGVYLVQNTSSAGTTSFNPGVNMSASGNGGVASADFNKDGKIDQAFTTGSINVNVYENLSTRGLFTGSAGFYTFAQSPVTFPHPNGNAFGVALGAGTNSIVATDFDGDGYDDIAAVSVAGVDFVWFRNLGVYGPISSASFSGGTAVALAPSIQVEGITASDFDGDGKPDIALVYYNSKNVSVFLNTSSVGAISFAAPITLTNPNTFGYNIGAQDLDGDGKPEIVTTTQPNPGTPTFTIFQNKSTLGSLSFNSPVTYNMPRYAQALNFADINSDQKPDILIVGYSGPAPAQALMVFQNNITTPVISINTQPSAVALCAGGNATFTTAASGTTNIIYQWQYSSDGITYADITNTGGYSNTTTSGLSVNTTGNFGGGFYRCRIDGDFANEVITNGVTLTVNALPAPPTASNMSNCGPGSLTLSASGGSNGSYIWYDPTQTVIAGQTNSSYPTPSITTATNYYVALTNGTCTSAMTTIAVTINSVPAAPSASNVNNCGPGSLTLIASGGSSGNYIWYDPTQTPIAGQTNSSYTTPALSATSNYYVAITNGTCTSAMTNVTATINTIPAAPSASNMSNCGPGSLILTASGGSNGNYIWYDPTQTAIAGQTNSTYSTPSLTTTTNYFVAIASGACTSPMTTITATINALPAAPSASGVSNCGPGSLTLNASGGSNGNYIWYDPSQAVIAGQTNSSYATPSLAATANYYVALTNGTCASAMTTVTATINALPAAPSAPNVSNCGPGSLTLTASGGSSGNYIWYDPTQAAIAGQTNASYSTPSLSTTANYYVAITNGTCTSAMTTVTATINTVPAAPTATGATGCPDTGVTLTASGASNGNYIWYDPSQTVITGQTNSSYTTPNLAASINFFVAVTNGSCVSPKTSVSANVSLNGCTAPVITSQPLATQVGGVITLNLVPLISTPNSTLDLSSLQIATPPASGATASISASGVLTIDYTGISFSGTENISIRACDVNGNCSTQKFSIDVAGDIVVYNGISPTGNNPILVLDYINLIPETKTNTVQIFDRWQNLVWHGSNYDNSSVVFKGTSDNGGDLPAGVYYYKIDFASGKPTKTGFISLKR